MTDLNSGYYVTFTCDTCSCPECEGMLNEEGVCEECGFDIYEESDNEV